MHRAGGEGFQIPLSFRPEELEKWRGGSSFTEVRPSGTLQDSGRVRIRI